VRWLEPVGGHTPVRMCSGSSQATSAGSLFVPRAANRPEATKARVLLSEPPEHRNHDTGGFCVRSSRIPVNQEMRRFTVELKDDAVRFASRARSSHPSRPGRIRMRGGGFVVACTAFRSTHSAVLLGVLREVWTRRSRFIVDQCLPAIATAHLANRRARIALLST